jgi:lipopolysaccharide/colanic/teichoic acid biosynthesis glycosyltransferase
VITESYNASTSDLTKMQATVQRGVSGGSDAPRLISTVAKSRNTLTSKAFLLGRQLSPYSASMTKRAFDCICVLSTMPVLIPALIVIGIAVKLTSAGPILFVQKRMGRDGRDFKILKFRTMTHLADSAHQPVTTSSNQRFTPVGPFLRRWKLDELPQLLNVLAGDMSLVGPRPKLPEHVISDHACRAGITGAATIAFALEEAILARVPKHKLELFYHSVVLPAKHRLDADYMANATFVSDLRLIVDSVLRRWDCSIMEDLLEAWAFEEGGGSIKHGSCEPESPFTHATRLPQLDRPAPSGRSRAF